MKTETESVRAGAGDEWWEQLKRRRRRREYARANPPSERLRKKLAAAGYPCERPERCAVTSRDSRSAGSWAWFAYRTDDAGARVGLEIGSQWTMRECLAAKGEEFEKLLDA